MWSHLPLPSPLPATKARSFLYSRRIAEDVFRLLASQDEKLVSQLAHSLSQVSNEDMWVFMCSSMSDNFIHCICGCPTAVYMQMVWQNFWIVLIIIIHKFWLLQIIHFVPYVFFGVARDKKQALKTLYIVTFLDIWNNWKTSALPTQTSRWA